jgi:hypothetical protein
MLRTIAAWWYCLVGIIFYMIFHNTEYFNYAKEIYGDITILLLLFFYYKLSKGSIAYITITIACITNIVDNTLLISGFDPDKWLYFVALAVLGGYLLRKLIKKEIICYQAWMYSVGHN